MKLDGEVSRFDSRVSSDRDAAKVFDDVDKAFNANKKAHESVECQDTPLTQSPHHTSPFRLGQRFRIDLEVPNKSIELITSSGVLKSMKVEFEGEGEDADDKAIKWAIVPFKGDPNKDLLILVIRIK